MFLGKKKIQHVVRPTILAIFLAFNLVQLGIFLVVQNSWNLFYTKTEDSQSLEQTNPKNFQIQVQKTISRFQDEFSVARLEYEMHRAHLMRDRKIHYLAALACGLLSIIIGMVAITFFTKTWHRSWKEIRRCSPQAKIVFKISFTSNMINWFTVLIGTVMTTTSALALRKLIYYRDEAWFTAYMNYESMTHLASHYRSTLILGIICLLWGIFSVVFHWRKPHQPFVQC